MSPAAIHGASNVRTAPLEVALAQMGGPAVLPSSEAPTVGQMQDAMSALYLMMSKLRDAQVCEGKTRVETNEVRSEAQKERRKAALEAAQRAASEGGVFDWLSEDIGLAGAVGLCTFNYALVAADIAVHKLDIVDNVKVDVAAVATGRWEVLAADILLRKTDLAPQEARAILEQVGIPQDAPGISDEDVKPIARDLLIANLLVASLVATVFTAGTTTGLCIALAGLAISTAGSQVAKHKVCDDVFGDGSSQWIGLGMQIYGAAASGMSGLAPGAALGVAANGFAKGVVFTAQTKAVGVAVQSSVSVLNGTDQMVIAANEKAVAKKNIEAEDAKMQIARLQRLLEFLVDGIKESTKSHRKAGEALQGALSEANETQVALAQGMRV